MASFQHLIFVTCSPLSEYASPNLFTLFKFILDLNKNKMHSYYSFSSPTLPYTQEKLTEEEIVALLQEADADKNGKIKFDHFLQVMLAK